MTLCGSVLEGYDSASAPLEPEEDARLSTLPFSPPHAAVPPIPPPSILLAHSLPLSLRRVVSTLSPSRSIAFCVVFTLVSLFFRFSQLSPRPLSHPFSSLSPLEIFPSRLHARVVRRLPRFRTRLSTRRLFRGSVSATSSPTSPSPPRREMPLPLHFHLTIILVLQILLAPLALSEETSAPARPVKFHYEINPGEYSYS